MSFKLSSIAPNFTRIYSWNLNLYDYLGDSWGFCFLTPKISLYTELGTVAKLSAEFEKRGVKVVAFP